MVFQAARLFPHLSVAGNLAFARRRALQDSATDYEDVLAAFDLGPLLPRDVLSLSGGERQRVAIARTLLAGPGLLLLDEPLAALDAARKNEILPYLETLAIHFSVPVLYVSHAIDEIVRLADQVLVLDGGRVREIGDASIVLNKLDVQSPSSAFEAVSVLDGTIVEQMQDSGLTRIGLGTQSMVVPELAGHGRGTRQRLFVRAGDVAIALQRPEQISVRTVLQGQVREIVDRPDGPFAIVVLDVDGQALRAELTRHAIADLDLRPGLPVYVLLKTATFDRRN
jgi:molybdate transport system ATP-binding protein